MGSYIRLHRAAVNHNPSAVVKSLETVCVNSRDEYGWTCVQRVLSVPDDPSEAATLSIVRILLQHGADLNLVDNRGRSPLHTAAVHNKPKTAEVIIANGWDVDIKDNTGQTALHQAVSCC